MIQRVNPQVDFVEIEHSVLDFWEKNDIFQKRRDANSGNPKWSFIDGPITANNPMGVHHAWGRTLKDIFNRYKAMNGYELRYQQGFDCQGLWVEVEVEKELGHEINIAKTFKFDPGRLDKTWIKNCVAVGLAANFVEPLEATSIGTSIQQAYLLMHNLSSPNGAIRQQYNEQVVSIMDNIRDFIYLHYLRWHKHNWFWKNFTWENAPPTLKKMLSIWQRRLPLNDDVKGSDFKLFWGRNYLQVLYGMGMYDYNKEIEKQYNCLSNSYKSMVDHYYKNIMPQNFSDLVSHKEYIRKLNGIPN